MNDYVKKILCGGLGLQGHEYETERSRRSGGPRPGDDEPPRMIVVKFLRYTARQKNERGLQWEDCTLSTERSDLRTRFSPMKA